MTATIWRILNLKFFHLPETETEHPVQKYNTRLVRNEHIYENDDEFSDELEQIDQIEFDAKQLDFEKENILKESKQTSFVQEGQVLHDQGAKYLGFFSSRSLKTREKCISFAQLVLLGLYIFWEKCVYF